MSVIWIIAILVVVGCFLQLCEFFIPSFGLITLSAAALFAIAIYLGFSEARWLGWATIGAIAVMLPGVLVAGFRLLPYSPMILKNTVPKPDLDSMYDKSVGSVGEALTDMRPVGRIKIGDKSYDAISAGTWISKGDRVLVTARKGSQLMVRPMLERETSDE